MASANPGCPKTSSPYDPQAYGRRIFQSGRSTAFARRDPEGSPLAESHSSLPRPSIAPRQRYRNINLLSIDYAFRPRLRVRLTPGGRTFPGNPWACGEQDSHLLFRYSCLHSHLYAVHHEFLHSFDQHTTLSYHAIAERWHPRLRFRTYKSRSFSAQNHSTSELLRTL